MRTSSRSLASSCRSTPVSWRGRRSAAAIALGLLASTSAAYAQPAGPQPAPAQPAPGQAAPAQPAPGQPAPGQPSPDAAPTPPEAARPQDEPLVPPAAAPPTGVGAAGAQGGATTAAGASPDPDRDQRALTRQGAERPAPTGDVAQRPSEVFSEDWWSQARPSLELHGLFRVRAELFHHFALGRKDPFASSLWPQPPDTSYNPTSGQRQIVRLCGDDPTRTSNCDNNTQASANMRFRLTPELHISDNLRVLSQIDIFDNVVLGSTPESYANQPGTSGGYAVVAPGGYAPLGAFTTTAWAPVAGQTSLTDSIVVKRVWGEYATPVGLLRFGRMPNQWGLGILNNEGNGYDSDWQSTVDRIMFVTGIPKYDLYFTGAWDFIHEGPISASQQQQQGQPYDLGQLDDVSQYVVMAARKRDPELARLDLAKGLPVINGGVYFAYRNQVIANDSTAATNNASFERSPEDVRLGYTRRGAQFFTPDVWFQFLYKTFRFEAEAAMVYGTIENTRTTGQPEPTAENPAAELSQFDDQVGWKVQQFGLATQAEFRTLEDKLRLDLGFGWASGDPDVASLQAPRTGMERQLTADRTYSTFRFHPDYRIDMILWRNVMSRVEGAYYFRPSVQYDFSRDPNGQRLGGSAAVIWSRASEFIQAPGHKRDLGIELNFALYFQAKDGSLNDRLDKMGGFYTSLQYGVLFPLGGLGYLPQQVSRYASENGGAALDTETAQILRWYLGIMF